MKKFIAILFVAACFNSQFALAQTPEKLNEAKKFVEEVGSQIIKTAGDKNLSESKKKEKIITVIDSAIDANWIARFVLGKNYKTISEAQKQSFTKLYRDFMINTYGPKFKNYDGKKFTVNEMVQKNNFLIAKAEFLPKDSNVAISVDFRVKETDGKFLILDFVTEGISLIETQRSEFNSAIAQKGFDKFLDDLNLRVVNLKNAK
jgi:phospholipid transport system substrate-binding protein